MTGVYKMMLVARIRKNNITLIGKILGILRARKNCAHYSHNHSRPNYEERVLFSKFQKYLRITLSDDTLTQ